MLVYGPAWAAMRPFTPLILPEYSSMEAAGTRYALLWESRGNHGRVRPESSTTAPWARPFSPPPWGRRGAPIAAFSRFVREVPLENGRTSILRKNSLSFPKNSAKFSVLHRSPLREAGKEMVTVAQSVELQIVVLAVAGSNPVGHPISSHVSVISAWRCASRESPDQHASL